jgi:DNA gyrase subunit A
VINIRCTDRNGPVVAVASAMDGDDAMLISQSGMIIRTPVVDVSTIGRNTQGVRLVNLKDDDELVALEVVSEADIEKYSAEGEGESAGADEPSEEGAVKVSGLSDEEADDLLDQLAGDDDDDEADDDQDDEDEE